MKPTSQETAEQRRQRKGAAVGGLAGIFAVGAVVLILGQPLALIPMVGAALLLVAVFAGKLGG